VTRPLVLGLLVVTAGVLTWWAVGRATADSRRLTIHGEAPADTVWAPGAPIRILTWNVAHARGPVREGWFKNWKGGGREGTVERLAAMGRILRDADAHLVVLNEVDFDAQWSGGLDQAAVLARSAGYPVWVEQRNYDLDLPFGDYAFGNAILSRLPLLQADFLELPPHSSLEAWILGAKAGAMVRVGPEAAPLSLVAVHLEPRSRSTRIRALPVLEDAARRHPGVTVLAGDFNASPGGWPPADEADSREGTILDSLVSRGWRSPRLRRPPGIRKMTFPTRHPRRALDWILVRGPVRILEARVLTEGRELSDHAPVLSVVQLSRYRVRPGGN